VPENGEWEIVSRETHFANDHLQLESVQVRTPTQRQERPWTIVHRKRAVVVAPRTPEGKFILIRQERIPLCDTIWEMPAGQIDDKGEPTPAAIANVAERELREETGYELPAGGQLIPLGHFFSSPGFTDECSYFFLAQDVQLSASGPAHDASETILDCRGFSADELTQMIAENEICDANTLSICARLAARGYLTLASSHA
jgi:ADP-ribose pyrophosphatase